MNVIRTLKWTARRDTAARHRLTLHVEEQIREGHCDWVSFDPGLTLRERALYIQGVHLVTGVVQLSEGMAHLFIALAQHHRSPPPLTFKVGSSDGDSSVVDDTTSEYLERAIVESLRECCSSTDGQRNVMRPQN
jgi:hypothetical protein